MEKVNLNNEVLLLLCLSALRSKRLFTCLFLAKKEKKRKEFHKKLCSIAQAKWHIGDNTL